MTDAIQEGAKKDRLSELENNEDNSIQLSQCQNCKKFRQHKLLALVKMLALD